MIPASNNHPPRISWEVIDRYFAGQASPAEAALIQERLDQSGGGGRVLDDARSYVRVRGNQCAVGQRPSWETMRTRIAAVEQIDSVVAGHGRGREAGKTRVVRNSAAILGALFGVLGLIIGFRQFSERGTPALETHTYATRAGQTARVTLPGGSQATLAPATTLKARLVENRVDVVVEGQVLFTVAHARKIPFIVRTRQSTTRVLGTTFLVRQYPADGMARVAVAEGRVAVFGVRSTSEGARDTTPGYGRVAAGPSSVLTANSLAIVNDSGHIKTVPDIRTEDYTAWTRGQLVFESTPLGDVVADLGRAYGVKIQLSDSTLRKLSVDWKVQTSRYSLSDVLPELLLMMNAHAKESGSVITIIPGRPAALRSAPLRPSLKLESRYGR